MTKLINKKVLFYYVDILYITFQISLHLSIFPDILLSFFPSSVKYLIVTLITISWFLIRFKGIIYFKQIISPWPFIVLLIIYILDLFQSFFFLEIGYSLLVNLLKIINLTVFFFFLINLFAFVKKKSGTFSDALKYVYRPLFYYGLYNIFVIVLSYSLIQLNFLDASSNQLKYENFFSIGHDNISSGSVYYFPANLSLIISESRLFFLQNFSELGIFTGLSHEPHVLGYLLLPAVILMISDDSFNRIFKYVVILLALFVVFLSTSATVYLVLLFIVLLEVIYLLFIKRRFNFSFQIVLIILFVIIIGKDFFISIFDNFIVYKTIDSTGSLDYSGVLIDYILDPKSLFGLGNNASPADLMSDSSLSIGFITALLDIVFIIIISFYSISLFLSKSYKVHFVGLAGIYLILHSFKISFLIFKYPFLLFMTVILWLVYNRNRFELRKKNI